MHSNEHVGRFFFFLIIETFIEISISAHAVSCKK